ncbi:MAG: hypothetical protein IK038_02195 [Bacteroidaceae bacterium]|nr:hypothetical protein [Bacteroidaceae bacterium]
MLITKKESKNLRYFARANYKASCQGTESTNGKVKSRFFPVFGLSYDETKADKGMVELTNIKVNYNPFEGTYAELMERLHQILGSDEDISELVKQEAVEDDIPTVEQVVGAVKEKSDTIAIAEKPGDILKETIKDMLPEGSHVAVDVKPEENRIDVDVQVAKSVDHIDVQVEAKPVEEPEHLFGPMSHRGVVGDALKFFKDVKLVDREPQATEEPEKKTIVVTGPICPERHDSGRDFSGLSEQAIAEAFASVVGKDSGSMKPDVEVAVEESLDYLATHEPPSLKVAPLEEELPVVENVEEAKKTAEETGTPVVTAVQVPSVHIDAAADGSHDTTAVVVPKEPKPKKSRAELYDLRIKCATMRLAKSYGEAPETDIGTILARYKDASEKLNGLYVSDGIKPYTVSEDAIREAYPDEYAALCP